MAGAHDFMDVDWAFHHLDVGGDPEVRRQSKAQAQKEFDEYLASRPYKDEEGNAHDPQTGDFVDPDEYFDQKRQLPEAEVEEEDPSNFPLIRLASMFEAAAYKKEKGKAKYLEQLARAKIEKIVERDNLREPGQVHDPDRYMGSFSSLLETRMTQLGFTPEESAIQTATIVGEEERQSPPKSPGSFFGDEEVGYEEWSPGNTATVQEEASGEEILEGELEEDDTPEPLKRATAIPAGDVEYIREQAREEERRQAQQHRNRLAGAMALAGAAVTTRFVSARERWRNASRRNKVLGAVAIAGAGLFALWAANKLGLNPFEHEHKESVGQIHHQQPPAIPDITPKKPPTTTPEVMGQTPQPATPSTTYQHVMESPGLTLRYSGDNIWDASEHYLRTHHLLTDNHQTNLIRIDYIKDTVLRTQHISDAQAHDLPVGFPFRIPQEALQEVANIH